MKTRQQTSDVICCHSVWISCSAWGWPIQALFFVLKSDMILSVLNLLIWMAQQAVVLVYVARDPRRDKCLLFLGLFARNQHTIYSTDPAISGFDAPIKCNRSLWSIWPGWGYFCFWSVSLYNLFLELVLPGCAYIVSYAFLICQELPLSPNIVSSVKDG